jgi:MORN repeat variant
MNARLAVTAASLALALAAPGCRGATTIACPPGNRLMGEAPPKGQEQWCQKMVGGRPVKDGPFALYRDDGSMMLQGSYKNGMQDGQWTMWYPNGQKRSVDHYRDGVQDGEHLGWYPNGRLSARGMYRNGQREGAWKRWGPRGIRNWEEVYRDGKRIS